MALFWVFSIVQKMISNLENNLNRKSRLEILRKIRNIRTNPLKVMAEVIKNYAYLVSFIILASIFIYGILLNIELYKDENKTFTKFLLLYSPPVFLLEYLWLKQNQFVKELLKRTDKKHTTTVLNGAR
jgi:hypothetical protein